MLFGRKKKLITHNGSFHADDIFATAALSVFLEQQGEKFEVIRTRDEGIIATGDYVFDVGGIYDEAANRFDHHQAGGAGKSEWGVEYSSFGLVWKKFGADIAGGQAPAAIIGKRLAAPIDAWDNGFDLVRSAHDIGPYYIQNVFNAMVPTWKEPEKDIDRVFLECVRIARLVLEREVAQAQAAVEAEEAIRHAYERAPDKRIVVLDKNYPFEYFLLNMPEPLFAVYPRKTGDSWGAKAIRKSMQSFENRKDFPAAWASLRGEELEKISGVSGAMFCHRALFLAVARTKEGAVALARKAVANE